MPGSYTSCTVEAPDGLASVGAGGAAIGGSGALRAGNGGTSPRVPSAGAVVRPSGCFCPRHGGRDGSDADAVRVPVAPEAGALELQAVQRHSGRVQTAHENTAMSFSTCFVHDVHSVSSSLSTNNRKHFMVCPPKLTTCAWASVWLGFTVHARRPAISTIPSGRA